MINLTPIMSAKNPSNIPPKANPNCVAILFTDVTVALIFLGLFFESRVQ